MLYNKNMITYEYAGDFIKGKSICRGFQEKLLKFQPLRISHEANEEK